MASADVTRRELSLGARDDVTGWPKKEYAETTIQGSFDPAVAQAVAIAAKMPMRNIPIQKRPFYTGNVVVQDDHIVHPVLGEYELTVVKPVTHLNQFLFYACETEQILAPADRAATSGTWHVDSDALKTDPRNRIKTWLDAYISYAVCDYEIVFAGSDFLILREFTELGNEIVSMIDVQQANAEYTYDHYPYKFNETTTITNIAKDTATLTATNILESFEQAIRDVATDHPTGSIRRIRSTVPDRVNIGGMWLWQNTITIEYTRANDDYVASYPTLTWGPSVTPTGTFTFPNLVRFNPPVTLADSNLAGLARVGSITQALGAESAEFTLTCDLDVEHSDLTWKRPQTTGSKTDKTNFDVFLDIIHNGAINQPYQTLNLGWGATMQVRLIRMEPDLVSSGNVVTLTFREYREASASGQTYKQRFGMT